MTNTDSPKERELRVTIVEDGGWLIHKAGRGWYRPNAQGYTNDTAQAGRYSHADAHSHSHPNGWDGPRDGITITHESQLLPLRSAQAGEVEVVAWLVEHPQDERYPFGQRDVSFQDLAEGDVADGWIQTALITLASHQSAIAKLQAERDEAIALAGRLKLEAQGHASEAKTANSTIYEIYQVLSGGKGEPGNWNGAEPARRYVEAAEARANAAVGLLDHLIGWIVHDCGAEVPFTAEQDATYKALDGAKP